MDGGEDEQHGGGGKSRGDLTHFLVQSFMEVDKEYYLAFTGHRDGDYIHLSREGGVDIEANWDRVITINVPIAAKIEDVDLTPILDAARDADMETLGVLITALFRFYRELHFELRQEEQYIKKLDEKSGSSLKLTMLNPQGRVWTMVAGGGASLIYTDTVVDLGFGGELANYGEYSGDPSTGETYEYAKTLLDLMTREKSENGKIFIIGGGIANFTDVAKTFDGIIMALEDYAEKLKEHGIKIYIRRGGPNYEVGLAKIRAAGERSGLDMAVHGPDMHMTKVVSIALKNLKGGA